MLIIDTDSFNRVWLSCSRSNNNKPERYISTEH